MIIDIKNKNDVAVVSAYLKQAKLEVGITSGCFDLFHVLHLHYLERCKGFCDILVVGVDSDDLVKETKGPSRPLCSDVSRMAILNGLSCVDFVFKMNSLKDLTLACSIFNPKTMFKNQAFEGKSMISGSGYCDQVRIIPDIETYGSTSEIISAIVEKGRLKDEKHIPF